MPYIESKDDRETIDIYIRWLINSETILKKGSLNYFLCKLFLSQKMSYEHARNFIGEIECAKIELYRRWVVPYEKKKMWEHGDV